MKRILRYVMVLLLLQYTYATTHFEGITDGVLREPLPQVTLAKGLKPIELQSLFVDTKIVGNIAQTTYEMAFYNPNRRLLEGELKLPLLGGQHIVGYALQIGGKYRESSVVEKVKAKQAFEHTIRQAVDPAIVEKRLGNHYTLRLYPIPSHGVKRVKVTIEELLTTHRGNYRYTIPFVSKQKLSKFAFHLEITTPTPVVAKLFGLAPVPNFEQSQSGYYFDIKRSNIRLKHPIVVALKAPSTESIFFQKNRYGSKNWFMVLLPKPWTPTTPKAPKAQEETIEIIWDTSLGAKQSDRAKSFAFLSTLFASEINTRYRVKLKSLDIALHDQGSYSVVKGEWKRLRAKIESLKYHGAKDLSVLRIDRRVSRVLLFSNGINSFSDRVRVKQGVPIVTLNSSIGADVPTLRYIAEVSGGVYLDLLGMSSQEAYERLSRGKVFALSRVSRGISDLLVQEQGEQLLLLGRIRGSRGRLSYTLGGWDHTLEISEGVRSDLIARVWATAKIEKLSQRYRLNRSKILALAKHYKIVTQETSLIVLDRLEDYIRYAVRPPKAMQKAYYQGIKKQKRAKREARRNAINEAIALLREQKSWYHTRYPRKEPKPQEESMSEEGGDIAPVEPVMEVAAAPSRRIPSKARKSKRLTASSMKIKLKAWQSDAPYLKALDAIAPKRLMGHYLTLQASHRDEASFYVDMAEYFYTKGRTKEALLILSNLLELDYDNSELIRVFAFKLQEHKQYRKARFFFQKVKRLRPFELQASRDLALAYERTHQYQKALNLHYKILTTPWDSRFSGAKIVSLNELNRLIATHKLNTAKIDRRLIYPMPVDMRIVINWSTDNTDMDLWVVDPKGEKTYYGNRISHIGGKISNDMTQGYGPEEFMLKKAPRGTYTIKVKYYASSQQKLTGPTVIRAEVYTKYASKAEKREEILFRVEEEKEVIELGEVVY